MHTGTSIARCISFVLQEGLVLFSNFYARNENIWLITSSYTDKRNYPVLNGGKLNSLTLAELHATKYIKEITGHCSGSEDKDKG